MKLAVVAIAAVRIMQIVIGRDGKTEQVLADAIRNVSMTLIQPGLKFRLGSLRF
jgi:hypothetical protein